MEKDARGMQEIKEIKENNDFRYGIIKTLYIQCYEDYTYAEIYEYLGSDKEVTIPDEIDGFKVYNIYGVFKDCEFLEKVNLSKHLRFINGDTFENCTNLKIVTGLTKSMEFKQVYIGFPTRVDSIFKDSKLLHNENGFVIIDDYLVAYYGEEKEELEIPSGVTYIFDMFFFNENKYVEKIVLPNSLNDIETNVFARSSLEKVTLPPNLEVLNLYTFEFSTKLKEIIFPEKMKIIGRGALSHTALEKVVLPRDLEKLSTVSFKGCYNLKEIVWNENLKQIDINAFADCKSLEIVHLPHGLLEIGNKAFCDCKNLRELYIPSTVIKIGSDICMGCESLSKVHFYHSYDEAKDLLMNINAFPYSIMYEHSTRIVHTSKLMWKYWDKYQKDILIKMKLNNFNLLTQDEKADFLDSLKETDIYRSILKNSDLQELNTFFDLAPKVNLYAIDYFLQDSISNENTQRTATILEYRNKKFTDDELDDFNTHNELIELGFEYPTIEQLKFVWDIEEYDDYIIIVGYNGDEEKEVIPSKINTGKPILYIKNYGLLSSFKPLTSIVISEGVKGFKSSNQQKNIKDITGYGSNTVPMSEVQLIEFPESFTEFEDYVFSKTYISKVVLPNNLEVVPVSAFEDCKWLKDVVLGENILEIKKCAFKNCRNLKSIRLSNKLKIIREESFYWCESIEEIILPDSLEIVEKFAFDVCQDMKRVILKNSHVKIHEDAFRACRKLEFVGCEGGENIISKFNIENVKPI